MKNLIDGIFTKIKAIVIDCTTNESHTLSADIKEFFARHVFELDYLIKYIYPNRIKLRETKKLKNAKKGKECFVFANGPSISLLDIKKIAEYQKYGFDVICVNSYIVSAIAKTVTPNFYVLSDPLSFGVKDERDISEDTMNTLKKIVDILRELKIPVFIPAEFTNLNLFDNYYIFNDSENRFNGNIDPTKPRGYLSMTAYKALAIACYLGYDSIYICGFDNDYFKTFSVDENNDIYFSDRHFYDGGNKTKSTSNVGRGLGNLLWEQHLLFKHLELFTKHPIINLNPNSLVDAFPKKYSIDVYLKDP